MRAGEYLPEYLTDHLMILPYQSCQNTHKRQYLAPSLKRETSSENFSLKSKRKSARRPALVFCRLIATVLSRSFQMENKKFYFFSLSLKFDIYLFLFHACPSDLYVEIVKRQFKILPVFQFVPTVLLSGHSGSSLSKKVAALNGAHFFFAD